MKLKITKRGFRYYEFNDSKGTKCNIQHSSSLEPCVWLGASDIGLKEFVAGRNPAWKPVELEQTITHHYVANNRMHLSKSDCFKIAIKLLKFRFFGKI